MEILNVDTIGNGDRVGMRRDGTQPLAVQVGACNVRAKAVGSEVLLQLSPDQQVVKIVRDELGELLGKEAKPAYSSKPPSVLSGLGPRCHLPHQVVS